MRASWLAPCLLKAKRGIASITGGAILIGVGTDRGSLRDFRSFAQLSEHELVHVHGADEFGFCARGKTMKIIIAQWVNRYLAHEEAIWCSLLPPWRCWPWRFWGRDCAHYHRCGAGVLLRGVMNRLERLGLNHGGPVAVSFSLLLGTIGLGFFCCRVCGIKARI